MQKWIWRHRCGWRKYWIHDCSGRYSPRIQGCACWEIWFLFWNVKPFYESPPWRSSVSWRCRKTRELEGIYVSFCSHIACKSQLGSLTRKEVYVAKCSISNPSLSHGYPRKLLVSDAICSNGSAHVRYHCLERRTSQEVGSHQPDSFASHAIKWREMEYVFPRMNFDWAKGGLV